MSVGKTTGQRDIALVKEETTAGTMVVPAGTDVFRLIADANIAQDRVTAESLERVDSIDITDLIALRYKPGEFKLSGYMKRTGTKDTAVASLNTILKNAYGVAAGAGGGTSIIYSLMTSTTTLTNFTIFHRKGNVGLQCAGAFVKQLDMNVQADPSEGSIFRMDASGEFYQMRWAGVSALTEAAATTDAGLTKIKVATADLAPSDHATAAVNIAGKYCIGAYIMVGSLTTSHKITDINPTTGVITVNPALGSDQTTGSIVKAYMPTESESGDPIAGHKGLVTYGGANYTSILQMGYHLTIPRRTLVEEKNDLEYPSSDALEGKRRVTFDPVRAYFDPNGTPQQDLFYALADRLTQKAIVVNVGNVEGYKWAIGMPQGITQEPRLVGEGIVEINMKQFGVASASLNDSTSLTSA